MATNSSILAWRIPWTEEPGGLLKLVYNEGEEKLQSFINPLKERSMML